MSANAVHGLPNRYLEARLSTLMDMPECQTDAHERFVEAAKVIVEFVEKDTSGRGIGIHLLGEPGTGKTYAAAALAHELTQQEDVFASFISLPDDPSANANRFTKPAHSSENTRDPFGRDNQRGVLVLDDVNGSAEHRKDFFSAVQATDRYGGVLIVTSNYTDPMFYKDRPQAETDALRVLIESMTGQEGTMRNRANEAALSVEEKRIYSRINGMMLPIIFEKTIDLRAEKSPWNNF